ncbi:MAG TPA: META domain-containing protein [Cellulomonas sp.]
MTDPTGTWRLVLLAGSPPAGDTHGPVRLTFDGDGMLYGMAGVNRVRATWTADEDDQLTVGPLVSTMMAGPADAMATERALLALLAGPLAAAVDDGGLRLVGQDGTEAVLVPDEAARS